MGFLEEGGELTWIGLEICFFLVGLLEIWDRGRSRDQSSSRVGEFLRQQLARIAMTPQSRISR